MAKGRIPSTGSQKIVDDISEKFNGQVKDEELAGMVGQALDLARRPIVAGLVLFDPVVKTVRIQGLLNQEAQLPVELLEAAFSAAIDQIKDMKAQQKAEQMMKQAQQAEVAAQTPPQEPPKTE